MSELTRDDVNVLNDNVPGLRGTAWHIRIDDKYFIVSAVDLHFGGFVLSDYRDSETMAFPADAKGEVEDWCEEAMVPTKDHWACIDQLLSNLGSAS